MQKRREKEARKAKEKKKKKFWSKMGISPVIATILLILIVVVIIAILWAFVIPFITERLGGLDCSSADISVVENTICYSPTEKALLIEIQKGANEVEVNKIQFIFEYAEGEKSNTQLAELTANSGKKFVFDLNYAKGKEGEKPESVSVAPILKKGNRERKCEVIAKNKVRECFSGMQIAGEKIIEGWSCASDADCSAGLKCSDNICIISKEGPPAGGECTEDTDCSYAYSCVNEKCIADSNVSVGGDCIESSQCISGTFCIIQGSGEGKCTAFSPSFGVRTCARDADCASFGDYFCSQVLPWSVTKWCVPKIGGPCAGDQACYQSSTTTKQVESYQENANLTSTTGPWTSPGLIYDGNWNSYTTISYSSGYIQMTYSKPENINSARWQVKDQLGGVRNLTIPANCLNAYTNKIVMKVTQTYGQGYPGYWQCDSGGGSFTNLATIYGYIYEESVIWNKNETVSGGSSALCIGWPFYGKTGFPIGTCKTGYKGTFSCEKGLTETPAECYQEKTNESTTGDGSCSLKYGNTIMGRGYYLFDNAWYNTLNVIDGNWDSYSDVELYEGDAYTSFGDLESYYILPDNVVSAVWQVKYKLTYTDNTEEIIIENLSIPNDCLGWVYPYQDTPLLATRVYIPYNQTSGAEMFLGCRNKTKTLGTGSDIYLKVYNYNGTGAIANASLYEEAVIWNVLGPSLHVQGSYLQAGSNEVKTIDSYVPIDNSTICIGAKNITEKYVCGYYLWKLNSIPSMEWILNKGNFNNIGLKQEEEFSAEQFKFSPGETLQTCIQRYQFCIQLVDKGECVDIVDKGCIDSDRNDPPVLRYKNYGMKGTATFVNETEGIETRTDSCTTATNLREFWCDQISGSDYWNIFSEIKDCRYLGSNGFCNQNMGRCECIPLTCSDLGYQCGGDVGDNRCSGRVICPDCPGDQVCSPEKQCVSIPPPPTPSVSWWKLNGNGLDSVGSHGTTGPLGTKILNTTNRFANQDSALYFSGVSDGYLRNGTYSTSFPTGNSQRSITAWIQTTSQSREFIMGYAPNVGNNWNLYLNTSGKLTMGMPYYYGCVSGGATFTEVGSIADTDGSNIADGNWHFVAGTLGGVNNRTIKLYIDGNLVESRDMSVNASTQANNILRIGGWAISPQCGTSPYSFNGTIDDVKLFDRELSWAEIYALWESNS